LEAGCTTTTDVVAGIPADTPEVACRNGDTSAGSSEVVSSAAGGADIASGAVIDTVRSGRHGDTLVNDVEGYPIAVAGLALDTCGQSVLLAPLYGLVGRADAVVKVGCGPADLAGVLIGVEGRAVGDSSIPADGPVWGGVDEKAGVAEDAVVLRVVSGQRKVVLAVGKRRETGVAVGGSDHTLVARGAVVDGGAVSSTPGNVVVGTGNARVVMDEHSVGASNAVASGVNSRVLCAVVNGGDGSTGGGRGQSEALDAFGTGESGAVSGAVNDVVGVVGIQIGLGTGDDIWETVQRQRIQASHIEGVLAEALRGPRTTFEAIEIVGGILGHVKLEKIEEVGVVVVHEPVDA
jgi:hypothetical protein